MIQSKPVLKSYFLTGLKPTQQQFSDLVDTLLASSIQTLVYTIGVAGVTGVDYNFTSVANTTKQAIQLGSINIIPAKSNILKVICVNEAALVGGTALIEIGYSAVSASYGQANNMDVLAAIFQGDGSNHISSTDSSVYFGLTPSANWSTLSLGKWKIIITYIDSSSL